MNVEESLVTGENVVFTTNKHWIAPVADSKWAAVELLAAVALSWLQPDSTTGILGFFSRVIELINLVLVISAVGWIVYNIVAWRTAEYYVTNRRVLGTEGLLRRRSTDSLLTSISDVRVNVPFLGRGLGYGNIKILSSSGDAGGDTFTSMRAVDAFKKNLMEQKAGSGALAEARSTTPAATPAAATAPAAPPAPTSADITKTLGDLAKLRDAGAITTEEYESKKADLLSRI
ncbi:MAG: PH domain-containing protein [Candidatus Limnocylindrales bacterium]